MGVGEVLQEFQCRSPRHARKAKLKTNVRSPMGAIRMEVVFFSALKAAFLLGF